MFVLFLFFYIFSFVFSANECNFCSVYKNNCLSEPIIPSYKCILKYKDESFATSGCDICYNKAQDLLEYCDMSLLNKCGTDENDHDNAFELCLFSNSSDTSRCKDIAAKYI